MDRVPMTMSGLERLETDLKHYKLDERPAIIQAIAEARAHGDLSENAEYHAAKERQSFVEGQITEIEDYIARAEVIDVSKLSGDTIKFGATIVVVDIENDDEHTYQIVGEVESDIKEGRLSVISPLARALIGKSEGDEVDFNAPGGQRAYEVLSVKFI
jgi:transcription elongation factor GreA